MRISLGCYNDRDDVDRAVEGLERILADDIGGTYLQQPDGSFVPTELRRRRGTTPTASPASATWRRHGGGVDILAAARRVHGSFWPSLYVCRSACLGSVPLSAPCRLSTVSFGPTSNQ